MMEFIGLRSVETLFQTNSVSLNVRLVQMFALETASITCSFHIETFQTTKGGRGGIVSDMHHLRICCIGIVKTIWLILTVRKPVGIPRWLIIRTFLNWMDKLICFTRETEWVKLLGLAKLESESVWDQV